MRRLMIKERAIRSSARSLFGSAWVLLATIFAIAAAIITSGTTASAASLSDQQKAFVDAYVGIAADLGLEYGIPWEAVMAQGIWESGAGTSSRARNNNNFFGIGCYSSNSNGYSYATPEDGWRGYYDNIRNTSCYGNAGAFNYPADPYGYIACIAPYYAADGSYVSSISSTIGAIQAYAEEKGYHSSARMIELRNEELARAEAERIAAEEEAARIAEWEAYWNGLTEVEQVALKIRWSLEEHPMDPPMPSDEDIDDYAKFIVDHEYRLTIEQAVEDLRSGKLIRAKLILHWMVGLIRL